MIILFDLDGTLIDSTEAILEGFHHSFDSHNHPHPSDEEIKILIGHPLDVMFSDLGVAQERVWDFVDTYKEHYRKISTLKTELLPQAREAVELASQFAELGIVTTKTGKYSQVLMEHFGIMEKFQVLIGREHVENPKPHAEPIQKALESFSNIQQKNIWMIGDTELDLISAQNASVNSIGVLSGYGVKNTLEKHTKTIFNNAYEAIKYLKSVKETHN
ncbi:HAD family hydrolase [Sulfurimonas marina]|uniref:phosphoglycolate phosphatase n=1 Tax=Sulfurimonas marina TaxID=2590551 RepID=A0A7M1B0E2_9BACT|nr:HAD family hydrolase [Sulfurimonas marina]QOP42112.1 HAD family hydrolase [Sulfurimonas marina]